MFITIWDITKLSFARKMKGIVTNFGFYVRKLEGTPDVWMCVWRVLFHLMATFAKMRKVVDNITKVNGGE